MTSEVDESPSPTETRPVPLEREVHSDFLNNDVCFMNHFLPGLSGSIDLRFVGDIAAIF
jgi:hypothetical protein